MPKLTKLPSLDIIHGFRGILDFYLWKGIPVVRKWPVNPKSHHSEATKAAAATFGAVSHAFSLIGPTPLTAYTDDAADQTRTPRDIYMAAKYGNLHEANMSDFLGLAIEIRDSLANLEDVLHALGSVDTDDLKMDVKESALPSGAATDAKLDAIIAALEAGVPVSIPFIIDGGGLEIATGHKGHLIIHFACTIERVTLLADQVGSIVIDIWKDTYANYPPTVGDSIVAAAKPTITADDKSQDSTLPGWTTSLQADDILAFYVDSCTDIEGITLSFKVTRA